MQQKRELPAPTAVFCDKKAGILRQLALPEAEYSDASPKGSVDAGIRHLIDEVNRAEGFVTTSSCAGRVSVFLEGRRGKTAAALDEGAHAQALLRAGLQAGFRESGAVSLTPPNDAQPATPMVAIRSLGLGFESLVGYETPDGQRRWLVSADLLETLRAVADERFAENARRIERFRAAFLDAVRAPQTTAGREWEDAEARRERKRAEGLTRQAALAADKTDERAADDAPDVESAAESD